MLPAFFMSLAGAMILLGLAALWQSLRSAFGGGPAVGGDANAGLPERDALLAEKRLLLRTIKDIQFERDLGKISAEDFERLDKAYRRRAKTVLALLETDIEPYLVRAEREIAEAMGVDEDQGPYRHGGPVSRQKKKGARAKASATKRAATLTCPACGARNDHDARHCKACATRIAPVVCAKCSTENDADAKFCKGCAASLAGSAA